MNNIIYLTDEYIFIKNKKQKDIIKYKINKNIILNGKIINAQKFIKTYELVLKKYNLNTNFFGDTIKIITNASYSLLDKQILKNIFSTLNYRKIVIENASKYLKLNQSNAYLEIYDTYQILSFLDGYRKINNILITNNFFKTTEDIFLYIKYRINEKELYLLGFGSLFEEFFNKFENECDNKTYTFFDSSIYYISHANKE